MPFSSLCIEALSWFSDLFKTLARQKSLGHLVVIALLVALVFGVILYVIDDNVHSPLDGIWSAWVTMTHVGFGDVVPVSFLGRLVAAGLILFGLVLFSLFTATLSVALIGGNIETLGQNLRQVGDDAGRIERGEERILQELAKVNERLRELENQLSTLNAQED